jgi:hypothetical protein
MFERSTPSAVGEEPEVTDAIIANTRPELA